MSSEYAIAKAQEKQRVTKGLQMLHGIVTGILADGVLHDLEIQLLNTWLTEFAEVARHWPASSVAEQVRIVLADGVVSDDERHHLTSVLSEFIATPFSETGSAASEPLFPNDDDKPVSLVNAGVVHTGEFVFGTRAACERFTLKLGGMPLDTVSKKADVLVVGGRVSRDWAQMSFGRKIERAIELKSQGHKILLISEQKWLSIT